MARKKDIQVPISAITQKEADRIIAPLEKDLEAYYNVLRDVVIGKVLKAGREGFTIDQMIADINDLFDPTPGEINKNNGGLKVSKELKEVQEKGYKKPKKDLNILNAFMAEFIRENPNVNKKGIQILSKTIGIKADVLESLIYKWAAEYVLNNIQTNEAFKKEMALGLQMEAINCKNLQEATAKTISNLIKSPNFYSTLKAEILKNENKRKTKKEIKGNKKDV